MVKYLPITSLLISIFLFSCSENKASVADLNDNWSYKLGFNKQWLQRPEQSTWHNLSQIKAMNEIDNIKYRKGYITLRKKLSPEFLNKFNSSNALAVYSSDISNVAQLYFDQSLITQTGSIKPYMSAYRKQLLETLPDFDFNKKHNLFVVLYTKGDFPLQYYGHGFLFGNSKNLYSKIFHREIIILALLSIYFVIGIYYFLLWFKRREDKHHLFVSLLIITIACFTFFKADTRELLFGDAVLWRARVENIVAYFIVPMMLLFLSNFFEKRNSTFGISWLGASMVMATTVLLSSFKILRMVLISFEISAALTMPYVLYIIIKHALKKNKDAYYLIGGILLILGGAVTDILEDRQLIESTPVFQYSILLFIVGIAVLLINRFIQIHNEVESLNFTLEKKVADRTRDLQVVNQALRQKDDLLQQELNFAADIQRGIIPEANIELPHLQICGHWQAMEKVSGDFYDIFNLSDKSNGILIADVSGHGVPAALVTMMAKVSFKEALANTENLSEIFSRVNKDLIKLIHTQDYLTAFFLTISQSLEMKYVNAAHQHAILQTSDNKIQLLDTAGMFIGAIEQEVSEYQEKTLQLHSRDRIILYTDGITERRNRLDQFYGQERLIETIGASRQLEATAVLQRVLSDVESFAEEVKANDDSTFIIIEVK